MSELVDDLTATDEDRLWQAEQVVRDFCGWHIAPSRTETLTFRGTATDRLFLPSLYVTEVDSVTVDGTALVEGTDYYVNREGYITRLGAGAWWGGVEIEVTFTHGYASPPESVTAAVQALAQSAAGNPGAGTSQSAGPFSVSYANGSDLLAGMAGLSAYRIVSVS